MRRSQSETKLMVCIKNSVWYKIVYNACRLYWLDKFDNKRNVGCSSVASLQQLSGQASNRMGKPARKFQFRSNIQHSRENVAP